jgi:hypothetical protein
MLKLVNLRFVVGDDTRRSTQRLIEEAENLSTSVGACSCFSVCHNSGAGGEDEEAELPGRKKVRNPGFNLLDRDIEARGDDTAFVEAAQKVNDDLSSAVVINELKLAYVALFLHDLQEFDDNLGRWTKQNLPLPAFLSVGERLQGIAQHGHTHVSEVAGRTGERPDN